MNNNAETRQSFIQLVMCRLGFHKWTYDKDTVVKCNKTCNCCGKKMHLCYDMSYGETVWLNGHYW